VKRIARFGTLALALGLTAPLAAQNPSTAQTVPSADSMNQPANDLAINLAAIKANKKALVASNMPLTQGQADAFWPVYDAYQADLGAINDRTMALINNYASNYNAMTEQVASQLTTGMIQIEQDRVNLMKSYLPRFQKVLPAKLVARYYQIENKIRAAVVYAMADQIPLVQ
jgi:hypothetical protein